MVVLLWGSVAGLRMGLRLGGVLVIEEPQQHPVLLLPVHLPLPRPPTLALQQYLFLSTLLVDH